MKPFIAFLLVTLIFSSADAKTKNVKIYFVPWSVNTFVAMDAAGVRKTASVRTEISDPWYADKFIEWLDEKKMTEQPNWKVQDLRLVIDATQDDGTVVTYYANRFALASGKTGKLREIGDSFRARFNFFYEE